MPAGNGWLSPREAAWIDRMRFPKRRNEFRLGRWTAKNALARYLQSPLQPADLRVIEIDRATDGAPAPLRDGRPLDAYLTMTDRADQAVCMVGPYSARLGVDLELVEARSDAFVADYLTDEEQRLVATASDPGGRDLLANLIWSSKESALKVLRTGLRRDTRSVQVSFPDQAAVDGWAALSVRTVEGLVFPGWWRRYGEFLLTVAATDAFSPPRPLVDPPGLATASPAHSWLVGIDSAPNV